MKRKNSYVKQAVLLAGVMGITCLTPALTQEAWADQELFYAGEKVETTAMTDTQTTAGIYQYNTEDLRAFSLMGWYHENGRWYWFNGVNYACNTWVQVDGIWYWFGPDCVMYANQWVNTGGYWYYLTGSGAMATGWIQTGGEWYYLSPGSGAMYASCYTPDGYYVNSSGEWVQSSNSSGTSNTSSTSSQGSKKEASDFFPSWFTWTISGYDAQEYDSEYLRVGKWVSSDDKTVLYTSYESSPDGMDYAIYYKGKAYGDDEDLYATVEWPSDSSKSPYKAADSASGFKFVVTEKGVMKVTKGGDTVTLYLERAKYGDEYAYWNSSGSDSSDQGSSTGLAYDNGYVGDTLDYSYAYRPWLSVDRDGTFTFCENFDGEMVENYGTYSVSGDTLTLKITGMNYGNEYDNGTRTAKFKIKSNGNLELTSNQTYITPVGTGFYVNTRE